MTDKTRIDAQKLDDAMANYPEFFDLDLSDIESHIDVIWAMRVPDGDNARNLDEDTQNELDALEMARLIKTA